MFSHFKNAKVSPSSSPNSIADFDFDYNQNISIKNSIPSTALAPVKLFNDQNLLGIVYSFFLIVLIS